MSLITKSSSGADLVYTPYRKEGNKAVFIGDLHTDLREDSVTLSSNSPKETSNSYGARRSTLKVLLDFPTPQPGTDALLNRTAKVEISVSLPAGLLLGDVDQVASRAAALLADQVVLDQLFLRGSIDISNEVVV
jgi:hypothetical protein